MTSEGITEAKVVDKKPATPNSFQPNLKRRYRLDNYFKAATITATGIAIAVLAWLILDIIISGLGSLDWQFLTSFASRKPEEAGILAAIAGTGWVMFLVALFSFPIGVGSGLYLEEFSDDTWFARFIEINISNLAGVPSIIYGLLGLTAFVLVLGDWTGGRSILTGALTLTLLILPIIIVATREALRAVPDSIRHAGYALGGNRWQVIWSHTLPTAFPGVLTGVILALSRAIGETAPLITIGALTFIPFLPEGPLDAFTVLPIQVYNWISRPQREFHDIAASGIIVLLVVLLLMNSIAVLLRNRFQKLR
ncbi:phosphate ABC transporter permease PstA [Oscillatoria sp. CS-180]|uniref:phosphate ABC transporter permease PstA n=1 Tax=Oscillatoria sp. CS-180 TaxID=3021720 RepID=UPI002330366D|nr:phosphate ABC transporter permease PstA [Oscillatoria sp. CS-180]MDB9529158.1 phosphate ABC transporter permease PstA [Oscillatoria sp. CS-180]